MPKIFSGARFRELREGRGVRRELLAVQIGYSFPAIVTWERGTHVPEPRAQRDAANALGCEPTDFFVDVDEEAISA